MIANVTNIIKNSDSSSKGELNNEQSENAGIFDGLLNDQLQELENITEQENTHQDNGNIPLDLIVKLNAQDTPAVKSEENIKNIKNIKTMFDKTENILNKTEGLDSKLWDTNVADIKMKKLSAKNMINSTAVTNDSNVEKTILPNTLSEDFLKLREIGKTKSQQSLKNSIDKEPLPQLDQRNEMNQTHLLGAVKMNSQHPGMSGLNNGNEVIEMSFGEISNNNDVAATMDKITDYINQARFSKSPQLSVKFSHESLGDINIRVEDLSKNQNLNLKILASTEKGASFFDAQRGALLGSLEKAGLTIQNIKIENANEFQADTNANQSFSFQQELFEGQNDQGKEKRNELWEEYRERMVA